jgi:VWFA-related protein
MFAKTVAYIRSSTLVRLACLSCLLLATLPAPGASLCAQSPQSNSSQSPEPSSDASAPTAPSNSLDSAQEVSTRDSPSPFSVRVNLVPIRVIVRDAHGLAVPDLHQGDFRVFEDGKLQLISHFSVETPAPTAQPAAETNSSHPAESEKAPATLVQPSRFVALLFDDVHLPFGDLARIRNIADDYVKNSFQPSDRFAILTISGQSQTDFTDDRAKLHEALEGIQPRSVTAGSATGIGECPSINYLQADLIINQHDLQATTVATNDALACQFNNNQQFLGPAQGIAQAMALRILSTADMQTQYSF